MTKDRRKKTFQLPAKLCLKMKIFSARNEKSQQEIVEEALEEYFSKHTKTKTR